MWKPLFRLSFLLWLVALPAMAQPLSTSDERALREAVAESERNFGPDDPRLAAALRALAAALERAGRFSDAEAPRRRTLQISERRLGANDVTTARDMAGMAGLLNALGRSGEAEPFARRGLSAIESAQVTDPQILAGAVGTLAATLFRLGRFDESETLLRRAIAHHQRSPDPDPVRFAAALQDLAVIVGRRGVTAETEAIFRQALDMRQRAPVRNESEILTVATNLGITLYAQRKFAEADEVLRGAIGAAERTLGPDHPALASGYSAMAVSFQRQGRMPEAIAAGLRAVEISERGNPPGHRSIAEALVALGSIYLAADRHSEALATLRRSTEITRARLAHSEVAERAAHRRAFGLHVLAAQAVAHFSGTSMLHETFEIAQLAKASGTAQALAGAAAVFAGRNDELGGVVREHLRNRDRIREIDAALTRSAGLPMAQRDRAAESAALAEYQRLARTRAETETRLARDFPRFAELGDPRPLATREAAMLLRPDEALLMFFFEGQRSHLWVLTRERPAHFGLPIRPDEVEALVKDLRAGASPTQPSHFPVAKAHDLYRRILAPAEPLLQGKQHLIVVLDRALESLPLGMLVTEPAQQPADIAGYAAVPWLAKKYATTVLPSVTSLRLLREVIVKAPRAPLPFAGFGDAATGSAAVGPTAGAPSAAREQASLTVASGFLGAGSAVNLEALRAAKALPETAVELRSIARSLGAGEDKIFLRDRFTKPAILAAPLDQYRVVAFSTHGAVAGEMRGVNEPFLLLTPPPSQRPDDDGMLRASDVARLRLNADWVLLTACNTAAGDGTPGAEGLSGLAKAFLSAGTRAVLVSHWSVESQSALRLVTGLFAIQAANPNLARAGALRHAMLQLMAVPQYSHPMFWAPFVLVGEGVVSG